MFDTATYHSCCAWHIIVSHNNNITCAVLHCYAALNCVALCSVQGQTQQSFRIILMPWLLPGNSCPGTEMNGCPWALSLSSSSLPSSFFSFSMSLTHTDMLTVNAVSLPCSFSQQTLRAHQSVVLWVLGYSTTSDSHGLRVTDVS